MAQLNWQDPPTEDTPALTPAQVAQALREVPGKWALVSTQDRAVRAQALAAKIATGQDPAYGAGFQAQAHRVLGDHQVYARYVGVDYIARALQPDTCRCGQTPCVTECYT